MTLRSAKACSEPQLSLAMCRGRARQRGFTLIELVVSLAAGLLISVAAFLLARNSSRLFQHEAGITSTQFANVIGMVRLKSDLRRAAFMSTANVDREPFLCGDPATWPPGMRGLAGITIEDGGSVNAHGADHALSGFNALSPDSLVLAGQFGSTEQFSVQWIQGGAGGGYNIFLWDGDGAVVRTTLAGQQGGSGITDIFRPGRYLRLVDHEGRESYGVITGINAAGPNINISVGANPNFPKRETELTCGCKEQCRGTMVNSVAQVLYDLRTVNPAAYPQYQGLYAQAGHASQAFHRGVAPPARTELVRVELDADGNEINDTLEVIAEYAVDLKFGLVRETPQNPPLPNQVLEGLPIGDARVYVTAGDLAGGGRPELIRAVKVRFSTRNARRDRAVGLAPAAADGGLLRYGLGLNGGFARMRTLVASVSLRNQRSASR